METVIDKPGSSAKPAETTVTETAAREAAAEHQPDMTTSDGVTKGLLAIFAEPENALEKPAGEQEAPPADGKPAAKELTETEEERQAREAAEAEAAKGSEHEEEITGLEPEVQDRVQKRIDKAVRQREEEKTARTAAEKERDELKAENAALKNRAPIAPITAPEANEKSLDLLENSATRFIADAEAVLDDTATPEERGRIEKFMASERLDSNGLKRKMREVSAMLTREIPKSREQLKVFRAKEAEVEPVVKQYFPWLDDPKSPEQQTVQNIRALMPELAQRTPAHRLAVGIYALGLKAFQELQKAEPNKGKAAPPKPAPTGKPPTAAPTRSGSSAAAAPRKDAQEQAVRSRFEKAPTRENATDLARQALQSI